MLLQYSYFWIHHFLSHDTPYKILEFTNHFELLYNMFRKCLSLPWFKYLVGKSRLVCQFVYQKLVIIFWLPQFLTAILKWLLHSKLKNCEWRINHHNSTLLNSFLVSKWIFYFDLEIINKTTKNIGHEMLIHVYRLRILWLRIQIVSLFPSKK